MRVILVHGFNDKSAGANNIDRIKPGLEALGYTVETDEADYGYFGLFAIRLKKHSAVLRIAEAIECAPEQDVAVITYSNGANYANKAFKYIYRRVKVIHCSPALNRKEKFPLMVKKAWIVHIKSDWVVWVASLLPFHPWGRMGAVGYKGKDERVTNIDYTDIAKFHGGMWKPKVIDYFVKDVNRMLKEA